MVYQTIESEDGHTRVDVLGFIEPNNGRELVAVAIFYKGEQITKRVLPAKWPYLNYQLGRWMLDDPTGRFVYVPAESRSKLLDTHSMQVSTLTYRALSASTFRGNSFAFGRLVEVYADCVVVTDLERMRSVPFHQRKGTHVSWATLISPTQLEISTYRFENGKRITPPSTIIELN